MEGQRGRSGSGIHSSRAGALATAQLRRLQFGWAVSAVGGWVFFVALSVYAFDAGGATAVAASDLRLLMLGPERLGVLIRACPALGKRLQAAARERMRRM